MNFKHIKFLVIIVLFKEMNSNLSDAGVSNLNCIDQLNINGELNEANNNLACSLQALNILAEVRMAFNQE